MTKTQLTITALQGIPLVKHSDDLCTLVTDSLQKTGVKLSDGDVIVVAQKIVSKTEGRQVALTDVTPSQEAIELAATTEKEPEVIQLILDESRTILRHRPGVLIAEHNLGFILANAGLDRSNVDEDIDQVLLLPEDPDDSAAKLRAELQSISGKRLGVIIADSVGRAWRMGTTGMALGSAGVEALANLRGNRDLFNRELQVSEHAVADSIASAAELIMGEAGEGTPVVVVSGLNEGNSDQNAAILFRPEHEDMFR